MFNAHAHINIPSPATVSGPPVQLLPQISNWLIRWPQLNAFRLVNVAKTTCWRSNNCQKIKVTLKVAGYWYQTGWSEHFRTCWSNGILTHNDLQGLQWMVQNEISVSISCVDKDALLMREATGSVARKCNSNSSHHWFQSRNEEHLTGGSLKKMGNSNRRPHPHLSA